MRGLLRVDPGDAAPLWRQIEEGVRRLVASRALEAGAPVPSVRELAKDLRINPATVAKAYQRLVEAGVLAMRRGDGTYVAEAPPRMAAPERTRLLMDGARRYAGSALIMGARLEDAETALKGAWSEFKGGVSRGEA